MSDCDAFGEEPPQPPAVEEDPAAAFLAREQDELAGLEDDNFGATNDEQTAQEPQGKGRFDNVSTPPFSICQFLK